ncbi:hypothetical protein JW948_07010 [bacterium]|nr:hypothetical protein [bacterium]
MKRQIYIRLLLALPVLLASQTSNFFKAPSQDQYIEGILFSIEQGIQQHRIEYIVPFFSESNNKDINHIQKIKNLEKCLRSYFKNSEKRKENEKWNQCSPDLNLSADWDFKIGKYHIEISGETADVNLEYLWALDIPIDENDSELKHPDKMKKDVWMFKKINGRWTVVSTELFLSIFKSSVL